jgi:Holliday junction resolvasome RuvABC DNA-binding subunit
MLTEDYLRLAGDVANIKSSSKSDFANPSNVVSWHRHNDHFIIQTSKKTSLMFPASRLKSVLFAFKLIEKHQQVYFGFENAETYKLFLEYY